MTTSTEIIPYQPMDAWLQALAEGGERRTTAPRSSVQDCPLHRPWLVTVRVVSTEQEAWPEQSITLEVELDAGPGHLYPHTMTGPVGAALHVDGTGVDVGRTGCQLSTTDWEVVDAPSIRLPDDDSRTFDVKLRPKPWIGLRVRHHDRDEVVRGVTLSLSLPEDATHAVTTADATVRVEQPFARYGDVDVTEATTAEGVWEVVA